MRTFWASHKHFWQIHLTVTLCTAVATGVLAGALIVGDSVRGSLRALTLERLGTIQHALLADRFFHPKLLNRKEMVPAILLNGTVIVPQTETRASKVNIHGVENTFFRFWEGDTAINLSAGSPEQEAAVVINEALQNELNVQVGDTLLVNFPRAVDIHPEFLLGQREASEVIQSLRLIVRDILRAENAGRFSLRAHQSLPLNAFIALPVLQKALRQEDKVNALFTAGTAPILPNQLTLTFEALGLNIRERENHFYLQSQQYLLKPVLSDIALTIAHDNQIPVLPTLTYLANTIRGNGKTVPYSTIVALPIDKLEFPAERVSGLQTPLTDEIILNTWAAAELDAKVGDSVEINYYSVGAGETYTIETAHFHLKDIIPFEGIAADRDIIPEFPGIHDTADMSEWKSPFPIDYTLIRSQDEAYWDEYGATPKAFIPLETGERLWKNRFGDLTAIRLETAPGTDKGATRALFATEFLKKIQPEHVGFQFLSLKADGIQASAGVTDFGMLFGGLSGFIIIAVALLVGMLFRIGVEQRSREIGILQAVGYPKTEIRRRFLYEGGIIAGIGSKVGCVLAIGYTQLMLIGLRTWWLPAIGTPFVALHMRGWSLLIGLLVALVVVMISIRLTVHKLGKAPTALLLAGETDFGDPGHKPHTQNPHSLRVLAIVIVLIIGALSGFSLFDEWIFDTFGAWLGHPMFRLLTSAFSVLGLCTLAFDRWLGSQKVHRSLNRLRFALKNAAWQPGASKTCVWMVSLACCIIVAVGANRHDAPPETEYTFVAEADIPLHHSLNTSDGRFELGFSENTSQLLGASEVIPFRVLPGEDVSCLNLYQPQKPQILGVSDVVLNKAPWWTLKPRMSHAGEIIAIGDENSIRWVLHLNPEDEFRIHDEFGNPLSLHLHALQNSLFQSQLIISESNFMKYFPSQSGYQYFLITTPPELMEETEQTLEKTLGDYGFDVTLAKARLASYRAVENTYISTFQSLGGLGVLLGTIGLALVQFRNIISRRSELATLRAFGFRRQLLSRMLFLENCFLLAVGMLIGTVSGLVSILASLLSFPSVPWASLTMTLLTIFIFGLIANAVAVAVALRSPLLSTLKAE